MFRTSVIHELLQVSGGSLCLLLVIATACQKSGPSPSRAKESTPPQPNHDTPSPPPAPTPDGNLPQGHARGHDHDHDHDHDHSERSHHFENPESYVAAWNDPERDGWQKPQEIVAALRLKPGSTVVDLGAGTGYLVARLSQAVGPKGQVIAADIEKAMLTFLDAAAKRESWDNVRIHQSEPNSPVLPAASVDGIVTLNTWHHIENRNAYAKAVWEVVRPGGTFLVVDFLAEPTEGFGPPLSMRLSTAQVTAELAAGGFQVEILPETMPRHYMVRGIRPN